MKSFWGQDTICQMGTLTNETELHSMKLSSVEWCSMDAIALNKFTCFQYQIINSNIKISCHMDGSTGVYYHTMDNMSPDRWWKYNEESIGGRHFAGQWRQPLQSLQSYRGSLAMWPMRVIMDRMVPNGWDQLDHSWWWILARDGLRLQWDCSQRWMMWDCIRSAVDFSWRLILSGDVSWLNKTSN